MKEFKYVIIGKKGLALSSTEILNNNTPSVCSINLYIYICK